MKNKSTSRSPKAFSLPLASPSLRRAFPLVVWNPLSERRQAFFHSPLGAPGLFWFEHRLKHDWRGPSYAMRSIQKKPLGSCRDDKKRALSCVALKKGPKRRASSLSPPAPAAARPALEGRRFVKRKKTEGYSLRENFRIGEAFGTGDAFISLAEAETIQSIRGFGEPKNELFLLLS